MLPNGPRLPDAFVPAGGVDDHHLRWQDARCSGHGCSIRAHSDIYMRWRLVPLRRRRWSGSWMLPQRIQVWNGELLHSRGYADRERTEAAAKGRVGGWRSAHFSDGAGRYHVAVSWPDNDLNEYYYPRANRPVYT